MTQDNESHVQRCTNFQDDVCALESGTTMVDSLMSSMRYILSEGVVEVTCREALAPTHDMRNPVCLAKP